MAFFDPQQKNYRSLQKIKNRSFRCGYCGDKVSSDKGYKIGNYEDGSGGQDGGIYICSNCQGPTFYPSQNYKKYPSNAFGNSVDNVTQDLNELYEEARECTSNNCHTSAVLVCRKFLMNIAVDQGADENLRFIEYVNYLSDNGFIPPNGKQWVDHIRKKGNEANHEIHLMEPQDSKELIVFVELLLKFIYEFPNMLPDDNSKEK